MLKIFVDCEMNAECVTWLDELISENKGSKVVAENLIVVMENALRGKIEDIIKETQYDKHSTFELEKKLKSKIMQGLKLSRLNNHGTDFPKTLLKVTWHQLLQNTRESPFSSVKGEHVTHFHEETILSSYVKETHLEITHEMGTRMTFDTEDEKNLQKVIQNILVGNALEKAKISQDVSKTQRYQCNDFDMSINFYLNLEEKQSTLESYISQSFDNIGLSDSDESSEKTQFEHSHYRLPLPLENLRNLKVTFLPTKNLDGVWELLHYDSDLKQKMYSHLTSSLQLSNLLKTSRSMVGKNRLFLLHGPPGTGKTTLCKTLCQKLAVRRWSIFDNDGYSGIFIEITCSQIFSRWFGESSKNLDGIFSDLEQLLKYQEDTGKFVCVLFDEVESLAFSRSELLNKNETTDSVRVLNCLMTHLDNLRKYPNFILLCTSNLKNNIDPAFLDRLDVSFFVDFPSVATCFQILKNLTDEIIESKVVTPDENKPQITKIIGQLAIYSNVCQKIKHYILSY